jgi:hypothetical protein
MGDYRRRIGFSDEEVRLRFWSSAEVVREVDAAAEAVRRAVLSYFTANLRGSPLDEIDAEIAYIPIIMPVDMHGRYKAILRYVPKDRSIEVRPHLDYEVFLTGSREAQLRVYLNGLDGVLRLMPKLNATGEQIAFFGQLLDRAAREISITEIQQGRPM